MSTMKKHIPEMMHAAPMRCNMIFDARDAAISPGLAIIRRPESLSIAQYYCSRKSRDDKAIVKVQLHICRDR